MNVPDILWNWYEDTPEDFRYVSEALSAATNINIDYRKVDGGSQLCLLEGYKNPIPLINASDGTLRLIAYNTLLNQSELPPLIAIEEPERNLHPGALKDIAYLLEQLA
ncbi:MAG: AAA family ATPase, partial [Candidatus Poribacteria bacterium]|nr:AAA family ATPase [Candidatus Poribacteria bacterium]